MIYDWRIKDCFTIIFALMLYVIYFKWLFSELKLDNVNQDKLWLLDHSESYPIFMIPSSNNIIDIN
mgnify:CR=1 FL=1